jgi:hypothetical protein
VLAGLAGAAGIAGTAQAVNLNPDGLGQVLIYPYYTTNAGNDTLLSVVNTSGDAKAVKVRFKEGFNSREVLDFNMYMSAYDVWVAAIHNDNGTPTLLIPDSTCTVPYLYEQDSDGDGVGEQEFLPYDYTGKKADGGPTSIARAAEGYFEMIEMGTLTDDSKTAKRLGSAEAASHVITAAGVQHPQDCEQLVDNWTTNPDGMWISDGKSSNGDEEDIDIARNSGGLFGGAAIINVGNGTMFSYDAKAIQGFDKESGDNVHLHYRPGNSFPNMNNGYEKSATVFFGAPRNDAVKLRYRRGVDAVSAVFMHEHSMNEFNIEAGLNAASEWVITFPTKHWYVDADTVGKNLGTFWEPDPDDAGCNGWDPGEDYPETIGPDDGSPVTNRWVEVNSKGIVTDAVDKDVDGVIWTDWSPCTFLEYDYPEVPIPPFTSAFVGNGEACEPFDMYVWDREEKSGEGEDNPGRPVVSPPPPGPTDDSAPNEICYEVNVLRFGNDGVFQPVFNTPEIQGASLLKTVDTGGVPYDNGTQIKPIVNGWARIDWNPLGDAVLCETGRCYDDATLERYTDDFFGLVGMPVIGFWAQQFENGYLGTPGASVLANYGGLFWHKGNVRRTGLSNSD